MDYEGDVSASQSFSHVTSNNQERLPRISNEAVKGSSLVSISLLHLDDTLNRTMSI